MALIDRLRQLWGGRDQAQGMFRLGWGPSYDATGWGFTRVSSSVYRNPTGFRCIQILCNNFARPDWEVYKPGTHEPLEQHPALAVLNRPAERVSGTLLQWMICRDLQLAGKSFWLKMQGADGTGSAGPTTGLKRLPADRVMVIGNQDDELVGFVYTDRTGNRMPALPEDIVYYRFPHPERIFDGLAPGIIAGLPAETDTQAARFNHDLLANDAALPGYLQVQGMSREDFVAARNEWESREYPGKTRFIGGTQVNYVKVGQTNQELTYDALRTDSKEDICRGFGVPTVLLQPSDATFANMGEARATLLQQNIAPLWTLVCDETSEQLGVDFAPPVDVGLRLDDIEELTEAADSVVARGVALLDRNVITINEMREDLGKEPVAWGDAPLHPEAAPGAEMPEQINAPAPGPAATPPAKHLEDELRALQKALAPPPKRTLTVSPHVVSAYEDRFARKLGQFFTRQGRVVSARLEAQAGKSLRKAIEQDTYFDQTRWMNELKQDLQDMYGDVVDAFGTLAIASAGAGSWSLSSDAVRRYITGNAERVSKYVTDTTSDEVRQIIADQESQGLGIADIARAVRGYFDGAKPGDPGYSDVTRGSRAQYRAEVVSRTEVIGASNFGTLEGARQSGIATGKTWLSAGDAVDDCADLDGETVPLDGSWGDYDQPPAHPNCRCTVQIEIGDVTVDTGEGD